MSVVLVLFVVSREKMLKTEGASGERELKTGEGSDSSPTGEDSDSSPKKKQALLSNHDEKHAHGSRTRGQNAQSGEDKGTRNIHAWPKPGDDQRDSHILRLKISISLCSLARCAMNPFPVGSPFMSPPPVMEQRHVAEPEEPGLDVGIEPGAGLGYPGLDGEMRIISREIYQGKTFDDWDDMEGNVRRLARKAGFKVVKASERTG